jgi:hypothetical protein
MDFIPVLKELDYMNHELKLDEIFNLDFIDEAHKEDAHRLAKPSYQHWIHLLIMVQIT